ncbi:alpha/beta hydrolase [Marinactinospora thermotolerans]|uniref:Tripeptidyl-peptidase B. Serine peptidase. MEROPS family S33 n=1 Tax=Marinactinospora thermotolerans DSM 45154 TaxID=1122192 RepID=A0A1T4SSQ6_9ACTN|nr:alpha/beta hydrolase [Marinactinospora thermotolerans]SKA30921.1 tripeptidyl-peptidase B. Serine peptidase. MEROPS family S33 [Marinactinospora thermotolerans DSM 45154]
MNRFAVPGAALALALLASGCGGASPREEEAPAPLRAFYEQEVAWEDCGGGFECADVRVPLDYDDPAGAELTIAVIRLPASGADPVGSLLVNPGGPGASGVDYARAAEHIVSEQVRERFDVVGFDPRGVGGSSPVHCLDREELDAYLGGQYDTEDGDGDPTEVTPEGLEELEEANRGFVEGCVEHSADLLPHIGTADVAHDLDVLRGVLGDDGLTYLGKSYGTYIGAMYAELHPDRVRALVLDGAMDPELGQLETSVEQAKGFTTALTAFVEDCLSQAECPLAEGAGTTVEQANGRLTDLLERTAEEPLRNGLGDGREVNRARVETGVLAALYSESYWPRVRSALTDAFERGDGTALLELGDELYGREPGGGYENSTAALIAVNCADRAAPRDIAAYEEAADAAAEASPLFGPSLAWGALPCAYWPRDAVAEPVDIDGSGAPPILVVGTTRDSATPYQWAQNLAGVLESGVLLTHEGDGHTAYRTGDPCVDAAVDAYLLEERVPEDGTVCA